MCFVLCQKDNAVNLVGRVTYACKVSKFRIIWLTLARTHPLGQLEVHNRLT